MKAIMYYYVPFPRYERDYASYKQPDVSFRKYGLPHKAITIHRTTNCWNKSIKMKNWDEGLKMLVKT